MSISQVAVQQNTKVTDNKMSQNGYIVNEQGKEVQITAAMIHAVCHQLLNQCRAIKN